MLFLIFFFYSNTIENVGFRKKKKKKKKGIS